MDKKDAIAYISKNKIRFRIRRLNAEWQECKTGRTVKGFKILNEPVKIREINIRLDELRMLLRK